MDNHPLKLWKQGETNNSSNSNLIKKEDIHNSPSPSKESELKASVQNIDKNKQSSNTNTKNLISIKIGQKYNSKNLDSSEIKQRIPQTILKLTNTVTSFKNSHLLEKNLLSRNAFINNFRPLLLYNNQNFPKNKRKTNQNKEKSDLDNTHKPNTFFETYKNYQKKFFSSTVSLNSSINYNQNKNCLSADTNNMNDKCTSMSNTSLNNTKNKFIKRKKPENYQRIKLSKNPPRSISNLLNQKDLDKIPMVLNAPITFVKNFKSNSEKERDEKNSTALLKLRNILDKNWEKRIDITKEFFIINQIKDDNYYNNVSLDNFANFIHDNIDNDTNMMKGVIETRIPMKEIINKGIKYINYSTRKIVKSNSMPAIKKNSVDYIEPNIRNKYKKMSFLINHLSRFRPKEKTLSLIKKSNNDKYQISEEGEEKKNIINEKRIEFRKFINKNYAANIINKFMRNYNEEEKIKYFNKRKVGSIYISDKRNLVNSINKQTEFYKLKSTTYTNQIKSIHSFTEKDFNDLYTELEQIKQEYISENDEELKNKEKDNFWVKTYENLKKKIFEKHPENILKEKKKLLEYIVYQYIKGRKDFVKDLLK